MIKTEMPISIERNKMEFYTQIVKTKSNEDGSLTVYGIASSDIEDTDGDIITSEAIAKAMPDYFESGAKLKEMHKPNSNAGKVEELPQACDESCKTFITAKVVDKDAIAKVNGGVYKGFSIGGSVVKRNDDNPKQIDEIRLDEISLVDRPANPEAQITLFKSYKGAPLEDEGQHVDINADLSKAEKEKEVEKVAEREDTNPKEGESKYGDVKFADEKNNKYPIDTEKHIRAAWNYINKPKNAGKYSEEDVKSIKAKIVRAWKDKIDSEGPPSAEEAKKRFSFNEVFDARNAMDALTQLIWVLESEQYEAMENGEDESEQITMLMDAIEKVKAFITSELNEEPMEKAGKELSTKNKEKLKAMHDHAGEIQKMCKSMHGEIDSESKEESDDKEKVEKALKLNVYLTDKIDALEKRLKELEAQPVNGATLKSVGKTEDGNGDVLEKRETNSQLKLIEEQRRKALGY